ncbi:hypothetical protein [Streptomyces sp. NBC_00470]|uniref:hypothetical protein n=1 Tax=Streptomyces sp. NBC_00470 TaxID=2975753 RepID=UPI0030E24387
MSRIYVSTQFFEDGERLDLISLALIRESDDAELYRINADMDQKAVRTSDWLMDNAIPDLHLDETIREGVPRDALFNPADPAVHGVKDIAKHVGDFIAEAPEPVLTGLWASYDSVLIGRLFGSIDHRPEHIPVWARETKADHQRLGSPALPPERPKSANALHNARHARRTAQLLDACDDRRTLEAITYARYETGMREICGYIKQFGEDGTAIQPDALLNFIGRVEFDATSELRNWSRAMAERSA